MALGVRAWRVNADLERAAKMAEEIDKRVGWLVKAKRKAGNDAAAIEALIAQKALIDRRLQQLSQADRSKVALAAEAVYEILRIKFAKPSTPPPVDEAPARDEFRHHADCAYPHPRDMPCPLQGESGGPVVEAHPPPKSTRH